MTGSTTMNGMLSQARRDAQALHQSLHITTIKDHAVIRIHLQDVGDRARVLAEAVKIEIEGRRVHPHRHLRDVVILLEAAASQLGNLVYSSKSDLCEVSQSVRAGVTIAVRGLSQALAAERCKKHTHSVVKKDRRHLCRTPPSDVLGFLYMLFNRARDSQSPGASSDFKHPGTSTHSHGPARDAIVALLSRSKVK